MKKSFFSCLFVFFTLCLNGVSIDYVFADHELTSDQSNAVLEHMESASQNMQILIGIASDSYLWGAQKQCQVQRTKKFLRKFQQTNNDLNDIKDYINTTLADQNPINAGYLLGQLQSSLPEGYLFVPAAEDIPGNQGSPCWAQVDIATDGQASAVLNNAGEAISDAIRIVEDAMHDGCIPSLTVECELDTDCQTTCNDGQDNDCDGSVDLADSDCVF